MASGVAASSTTVDAVVKAFDALTNLIKFNMYFFNASGQVIEIVKSFNFEGLVDKYLLAEPLRVVKSAFQQRFPDAPDDQMTFFDDLIARCGTASVNVVPTTTSSQRPLAPTRRTHGGILDPKVRSLAFAIESNSSSMLPSFCAFLSSIWETFERSDHYKYFMIVQSSGAGKTRLMDIFCKTFKRVLVYAGFADRISGLPVFLPVVKSFESAIQTIRDQTRGTRLWACMNLIRAVVYLSCTQGDNGQFKCQDGLVFDKSSTEKFYHTLWATAMSKSQTPGFFEEYTQWINSGEYFNELEDFENAPLPGPPDSKAHNFKVFIVIDEISHLLRDSLHVIVTLGEWERDPTPKEVEANAGQNRVKSTDETESFEVSAYQLLCRAMFLLHKDFVKLGVIAVFIDSCDTRPIIATPSGEVNPSSSRDSMFCPVRLLPVYSHINAEPTLFSRVYHPFLFGRPMIGAYYAALEENKEQAIIKLGELKMANALKSIEYFKPSKYVDNKCTVVDFVAATMSCLLDLEINSGSALPHTLVRSFMATYFYASDDRKIEAHYPCEPVLARGALNNLLSLHTVYQSQALNHFQQLRRLGILDICSETVAELFCLLCLDVCYSFDAKFQLSVFLLNLLGARDHWQGGIAYSDIIKAVQSVFGAGPSEPTVNLCQFQFFNEHPMPEDLERCYNLGMGIMMAVNAAAIDLVIPLRLSDGRYSAIVIQVKNWNRRVKSVAANKLLNKIGWIRVFRGMTDKAFKTRRRIGLDPVHKYQTPSTATATSAAVVEQPRPSILELESRFGSIPYCKLLFLMRDDGPNELRDCSNSMEFALNGVLRGVPRSFHPMVRQSLEPMVADFHTHRFQNVVNSLAPADPNTQHRLNFMRAAFGNSVKNFAPDVESSDDDAGMDSDEEFINYRKHVFLVVDPDAQAISKKIAL